MLHRLSQGEGQGGESWFRLCKIIVMGGLVDDGWGIMVRIQIRNWSVSFPRFRFRIRRDPDWGYWSVNLGWLHLYQMPKLRKMTDEEFDALYHPPYNRDMNNSVKL